MNPDTHPDSISVSGSDSRKENNIYKLDDADITLIQNKLNDKFGNGLYESFIEHLRIGNAIIAGGFVLSLYGKHKFDSRDIDIYVKQSKALEIYKLFIDNNAISYSPQIAPEYDSSFFKQNQIVVRYPLLIKRLSFSTSIDLMVVPDEHIMKTVTNFDLTCCEIMFNGDAILCTEKTAINDGITKLRAEYFNALVNEQNGFLKERIQKYKYRNYNIYYETIQKKHFFQKRPETLLRRKEEIKVITVKTQTGEEETYEIVQYIEMKDDEAEKLWLCKTLYKLISNQFFLDLKDSMILKTFPINNAFTLENLKTLLLSLNLRAGLNESYQKMNDDVYFEIMNINAVSFIYYNSFKLSNSKYIDIIKRVLKIYNCHTLLQNPKSENLLEDYKFCNLNISSHIEILNRENKNEEQPTEAFDFIMYTKVPIDYNTNNVYFVIDKNIFVYDKNDLDEIVSNRNDNWFYECGDDFITGSTKDKRPVVKDHTVYVKMTVSECGMNGLVRKSQILRVFKSDSKMFLLTTSNPASIDWTISWQNIYGKRNYVSANHCQHGTKMMLYDIKELNFEKQSVSEGGKKPEKQRTKYYRFPKSFLKQNALYQSRKSQNK